MCIGLYRPLLSVYRAVLIVYGVLFSVCGSLCVCCNTLQHTATHCNALQHTVTHCNTLQHSATLCNTLFSVCVGLFTCVYGSFRAFKQKYDAKQASAYLKHTATTLQHGNSTATVLQHCNAPQIIFNQSRCKQIYNNTATTLQLILQHTGQCDGSVSMPPLIALQHTATTLQRHFN